MSDPMTNMEIEDVLSSIRRLVSEDHRAPVRRSTGISRRPDKLVLTPALRIVPVAPAPAPAVLPDLSPPLETPTDVLSNEAAAAVLEAALATRSGEWEPDGSEVAGGTDWTVEWEAGGTVEVSVADYTAPDLPPSGLGATEAASPFEQSDPVAETAPQDAVPDSALASESTPVFDASHDADGDLSFNLDDDIAALPIDEEAIRDIVREILREELHGPLGERITRNVRKLVRAEINLALAAREIG